MAVTASSRTLKPAGLLVSLSPGDHTAAFYPCASEWLPSPWLLLSPCTSASSSFIDALHGNLQK